jgi:hypothetical protein
LNTCGTERAAGAPLAQTRPIYAISASNKAFGAKTPRKSNIGVHRRLMKFGS